MNIRSACVGIVDYGAGNIQSIENAFDHLGARTQRVRVPGDFLDVSHMLLPGVGAFGYCAERLRATDLIPALEEWAVKDGKPTLGICVGMQLLADIGEELGRHEGLGWIGGTVRAMTPGEGMRIPHVGWNDVRFEEEFGDFRTGDSADFYFDHSFTFQQPVRGSAIGTCEHGQRFAAVLRAGNLVAAQFHPEKSQTSGLNFLRSFLALD